MLEVSMMVQQIKEVLPECKRYRVFAEEFDGTGLQIMINTRYVWYGQKEDTSINQKEIEAIKALNFVEDVVENNLRCDELMVKVK